MNHLMTGCRWGIAVAGLLLAVAGADGQVTRIACLGDSITAGARAKAETESYPARLQDILGKRTEVRNFGIGGATLIQTGSPNVWSQLKAVEEFQPDVVVVSLGTNDTVGGRRANWEQIDRFDDDFQQLIDRLAKLDAKPRIVLCTPTAIVLDTPGLAPERKADLQVRQPRLQQLCNRIRKLAAANRDQQVSLLDLNAVLRDHPEWLTPGDGVHPNPKGYQRIAEAVARHLKTPPESPDGND